MDTFLATALSNCKLKNGVLSVLGLNTEQVNLLNEELRVALLENMIPHYRVVGVNIYVSGCVADIDYITKSSEVSKSYTELLRVFNELIFAEGGGEPDIKFRSDELSNLGFIRAIEKEITSSNNSLYYSGKGICNIAEALVKDVNIIKFLTAGRELKLVIRRNIGMFDFIDKWTMCEHEYKPVRAVYDLNNIFCIMLPKKGDKNIYFMYKKKINEKVLEKILQDFGKDFIQ